MWRSWTPPTLLAGKKWKTVRPLLKKFNMELPYNPTIPLPDTYQREMKTYVYTKTYTQKFIAALTIMTKR